MNRSICLSGFGSFLREKNQGQMNFQHYNANKKGEKLFNNSVM